MSSNMCSLCPLYPSNAADEEDSVDLGGRRIIKKKNININTPSPPILNNISHTLIQSYKRT